jgi:serine/threonine/tyrosine-interacting protein
MSHQNPTDEPVENPIEWKYEMRREMQEILPHIFVGPFSISRNLSNLQKHGITHILIIRDPEERHILTPKFPGQFIYHIM